MNRIIILLAVITALTGCRSADVEEVLLNRSDISLTWKGESQVTYDSKTYQLGYNDKRYEYRVYDDRLSNWFDVRCSQRPDTEGQSLSADVKWTGKKTTKSFNGLPFTVQKIDDTGMVWLWNDSNRIGIIIKNI